MEKIAALVLVLVCGLGLVSCANKNLENGGSSGPVETEIPVVGTQQNERTEAQNLIVNIVDRTKEEPDIGYDTALEKFFEDEENEYYFSGIYSHYVIVHYQNGSQEDIVSALNSGKATMADMERFDIDYITQPKDNREEETIVGSSGDYPAAIMVNHVLYYYTNTGFPADEIEEDDIIGYTSSYTDHMPKQNGETNVLRELGAPYAEYDNGIVVLMYDRWGYFEPQK